MDFQVSARKYRPATFDDVIGQRHVVQTLTNAIVGKRVAHAFLFSGTRGVGKTTMARILAKALNCEHGPTPTPCGSCPNCAEIAQGTSVDVIEIDGASNTSVDDVRELRENVKFTPFRGTYRIYIIDEVHMLSNSAFNALLKTLEEPPPHVVFIFATTEIHKIPATILSRCQHYNFRRIAKSEIVRRLRHVALEDGIEIEERSLASIARAAQGSMRDALSLLDQAIAYGGKTVQHTDLEVLLGAVPHEHLRAMITAATAQDSAGAVRVIAQLLDQGHDLRAYCAELVEYVRHLLVAAVVPDAAELQALVDGSEDELRQILADARAFTAEELQELFRLFSKAEDELRLSAHPRFVLEVAAVRATRLRRFGGAAPHPAPAVTGEVTPNRSSGPTAKPTASPPAPRAAAARSSPTGRSAPPGSGPSTRPSDAAPVPPGAATREAPKTGAPEPARRPATPEQPGTSGIRAGQGRASLPGGNGPSSSTSAALASAPAASRQQRPASNVRLDWEQVLDRIEAEHPQLAPFLSKGAPLGVEDGQVTVGYPPKASVARAMVAKPENLGVITAVCGELLGYPVRVALVELTEEQKVTSMAELRASRDRDQKQALMDETRSHPLIKQALELFGADLVTVRRVSPEKEKSE